MRLGAYLEATISGHDTPAAVRLGSLLIIKYGETYKCATLNRSFARSR
jgi:hypothetical protein